MIGPPNEDDNFSSFYVTWHHVLTIFFFFQLLLIKLARTMDTHRPKYNSSNHVKTELSSSWVCNCNFERFFSWFKFCLHFKRAGPQSNWKLRAWRQQQRMLGLLSLRGPAVSLYSVSNFKTRKNENIWMKKKRFLNQSYRKIPTRMS